MRVFNPLMLRMHAKEHARNVQPIAEARQSAAQLPAWSNKSELEAALRHVGLGEWAPRLAELARHCILLVPGSIDEHAAPIGASRLGGQPDMPPDLNWPLRPPVMAPWEGPRPGRCSVALHLVAAIGCIVSCARANGSRQSSGGSAPAKLKGMCAIANGR